jgi:hypothetical protein
MLPFEISHFPAQFLKPLTVERTKRRRQTSDAAKAEAKERVISVLLLICVLVAGVYGEILGYAF